MIGKNVLKILSDVADESSVTRVTQRFDVGAERHDVVNVNNERVHCFVLKFIDADVNVAVTFTKNGRGTRLFSTAASFVATGDELVVTGRLNANALSELADEVLVVDDRVVDEYIDVVEFVHAVENNPRMCALEAERCARITGFNLRPLAVVNDVKAYMRVNAHRVSHNEFDALFRRVDDLILVGSGTPLDYLRAAQAARNALTELTGSVTMNGAVNLRGNASNPAYVDNEFILDRGLLIINVDGQPVTAWPTPILVNAEDDDVLVDYIGELMTTAKRRSLTVEQLLSI